MDQCIDLPMEKFLRPPGANGTIMGRTDPECAEPNLRLGVAQTVRLLFLCVSRAKLIFIFILMKGHLRQ